MWKKAVKVNCNEQELIVLFNMSVMFVLFLCTPPAPSPALTRMNRYLSGGGSLLLKMDVSVWRVWSSERAAATSRMRSCDVPADTVSSDSASAMKPGGHRGTVGGDPVERLSGRVPVLTQVLQDRLPFVAHLSPRVPHGLDVHAQTSIALEMGRPVGFISAQTFMKLQRTSSHTEDPMRVLLRACSRV